MELKKIVSVDFIVVHCSATPPSMNTTAKDIDQWHRARGWLKIGYHYVIRRDGLIEKGRADDEVGAHAPGYNQRSLGICIVGGVDAGNNPEANFTEAQWASFKTLLTDLKAKYPAAVILGHRDCNGKENQERACPSFDVKAWLAENPLS